MKISLPRGVTISVLTDDGVEVVLRIQGDEGFVAERIANSGKYFFTVLPFMRPGQERRIDCLQGSEERAN